MSIPQLSVEPMPAGATLLPGVKPNEKGHVFVFMNQNNPRESWTKAMMKVGILFSAGIIAGSFLGFNGGMAFCKDNAELCENYAFNKETMYLAFDAIKHNIKELKGYVFGAVGTVTMTYAVCLITTSAANGMMSAGTCVINAVANFILR